MLDDKVVVELAHRVAELLKPKTNPPTTITQNRTLPTIRPDEFWLKVCNQWRRSDYEGSPRTHYQQLVRANPEQLVNMLNVPFTMQLIDDLSWVSIEDMRAYARQLGLPELSPRSVYKVIEQGVLEYRSDVHGVDQFRFSHQTAVDKRVAEQMAGKQREIDKLKRMVPPPPGKKRRGRPRKPV